jgi:hypothetical protein
MWTLLFLLLAAHALCDFALQNDYVAREKANSLVVMASHAVLHGAAVTLLTGSLVLGCVETVLHAAIDTAKCRGRIGFNTDQLLHVACKVGYVLICVACA